VSYSLRTFVVGPDDILYRLASAKFSRMVDNSDRHQLERFAGQRVRMVEAVVELHERRPHAVARLAYRMLGFDAEGRLDRPAFVCQSVALAELAVGRVLGRSVRRDDTIVDAGARFAARGGTWRPSPALERKILRAALDELRCERL
jgi:hypothetical protein